MENLPQGQIAKVRELDKNPKAKSQVSLNMLNGKVHDSTIWGRLNSYSLLEGLTEEHGIMSSVLAETSHVLCHWDHLPCNRTQTAVNTMMLRLLKT